MKTIVAVFLRFAPAPGRKRSGAFDYPGDEQGVAITSSVLEKSESTWLSLISVIHIGSLILITSSRHLSVPGADLNRVCLFIHSAIPRTRAGRICA